MVGIAPPPLLPLIALKRLGQGGGVGFQLRVRGCVADCPCPQAIQVYPPLLHLMPSSKGAVYPPPHTSMWGGYWSDLRAPLGVGPGANGGVISPSHGCSYSRRSGPLYPKRTHR